MRALQVDGGSVLTAEAVADIPVTSVRAYMPRAKVLHPIVATGRHGGLAVAEYGGRAPLWMSRFATSLPASSPHRYC